MKKFTNKKRDSYLFVEVPEDANYWINPYTPNFIHIGNLHGDAYSQSLPKGNYELIGLAKDVGESKAADIVDEVGERDKWKYRIYNERPDILSDKPTESLYSLVQSLGFNNPIILKKI